MLVRFVLCRLTALPCPSRECGVPQAKRRRARSVNGVLGEEKTLLHNCSYKVTTVYLLYERYQFYMALGKKYI